jgi:hypothetical protein
MSGNFAEENAQRTRRPPVPGTDRQRHEDQQHDALWFSSEETFTTVETQP